MRPALKKEKKSFCKDSLPLRGAVVQRRSKAQNSIEENSWTPALCPLSSI